jgi:hypothetical protein
MMTQLCGCQVETSMAIRRKGVVMLSLAQLFSPRRAAAIRDGSERSVMARLVRDLHEARARLEGQPAADDFLQRSGRTLLLAETSSQQRGAHIPSKPLLEALETIFAGSAADGRWLNAASEPCGEYDAQAQWVAYGLNEQTAWVDHVAHIARDALEQVDGYLAAGGETQPSA